MLAINWQYECFGWHLHAICRSSYSLKHWWSRHSLPCPYIGICWFLSIRHVVDSLTWQNVLALKGLLLLQKRGTKQIMICFVPCMFLHPVSTPCFYTLFLHPVSTPNYTQHTAINHVIIVLEQSSLTRHTPFQLGFMQRSPIPMYKS